MFGKSLIKYLASSGGVTIWEITSISRKKCLEINDIMQFIKSFETWQLTGHDVDKVDFGVTIINVLRWPQHCQNIPVNVPLF